MKVFMLIITLLLLLLSLLQYWSELLTIICTVLAIRCVLCLLPHNVYQIVKVWKRCDMLLFTSYLRIPYLNVILSSVNVPVISSCRIQSRIPLFAFVRGYEMTWLYDMIWYYLHAISGYPLLGVIVFYVIVLLYNIAFPYLRL